MLSRFPRRVDAALFVGLSLLTVVLSAVSIAGSLAYVGKTFPGFMVWNNLVVVSLGRPEWTGTVAQLPFRARVVAIDGAPVGSSATLYATVRATPPGTLHNYELETQTGREVRVIASMVLRGRDYALTMGVYVLNGVIFLLSGLAVFYLKPESRQSRALLAFGFVYGLALVLCPDLFTTGRLRWCYFILQGMFPAASLHQGLLFPEPRWPVKHSTWPIAWLYLLGLIIGMIEVWTFADDVPTLLAIDGGVYFATAAAGAVALATLTWAAFGSATPLARRRARVVLAGGMLAFLVPVVALPVMILLEQPFAANRVALTGFVFPLAIGYAVARHDLFEADRFVKLSLEYALLTAAVSLAYTVVVLGADRLVAGFAIRSNPLFPIAFVMVALATIAPLRLRVQRAVDRLFYRGQVDYKATVARASERLTTLLERDEIVRQVLTVLREVLFVESASVWERVDDQLVCRGATPQGGLAEMPVETPAIAQTMGRGRPLSRDEIQESPRFRTTRPELLELFDRLGATLVVPFTREGAPAGLLVIGQKASGGPLSADDVDVLRTLANQTAVSLATAAAVEARRDAHERMRRAEQLAAIGELSTAVAHGIRNPLAAIRLAAQLGVEATGSEHPVRENLEDVLTEVDKLEGQVRGILDFARPFEPTLEAVDLPALISSLLRTLSPKLNGGRVVAETRIPEGLPHVCADQAHLRQALQEIIVNACEAMTDGGRLTIAAGLAGNHGRSVRISLTDTGPGVPPELRERIFRLFATTKRTGTGVGLAVARKIIERHGGSIAIEAADPRGARFVIVLPVAA